MPGVPVVYRPPEERAVNPDRLNLDRRHLTVCPILEGEDRLRLLNLQHNSISRLQHLSNLRRLVFLDLYDNLVHEVTGLEGLLSLRVLMLGKNRWVGGRGREGGRGEGERGRGEGEREREEGRRLSIYFLAGYARFRGFKLW